MTSSLDKKFKQSKSMHSYDIELSTLVGREILLMSNKLKSKSQYSKVVLVHDNIISIDNRIEENTFIEFENNQSVVVQFDYKGQRLSSKASVIRTDSGRLNIVLDETVIPLNRRMFKRYTHACQVRCAIIPIQRLVESDLSKLRWLQVEALNISSGGILLPIPSKITDGTYLLLNVDYESPHFPNLLIGQVKHSRPINSFNFHVGINFIISEEKNNYFSPLTLKKIPSKAFDYTIKTRNRFDKFLLENLSDCQE